MNPESVSGGKFDMDMVRLRAGLLPDAKLYVTDSADIENILYHDVGSLKGVDFGFDPADDDDLNEPFNYNVFDTYSATKNDGDTTHYHYQGPRTHSAGSYGSVEDPRDFTPGSYLYTVRKALSLGCGMVVYIHDRTLDEDGNRLKTWALDAEAPKGQMVEYVVD